MIYVYASPKKYELSAKIFSTNKKNNNMKM